MVLQCSPHLQLTVCKLLKTVLVCLQMDEFSHAVGIPLNCLMGVKNYSEETDTNDIVDTLLLIALRNMVNSGMDFVRKMAANR